MEVAILKFNNDAYNKGKSMQTSYLPKLMETV